MQNTILTNDIEILRTIYVLFPDIEQANNIYKIFYLACQVGNVDIFRQLIIIYPDVDFTLDNYRMFNIAVKHNNLELAILLHDLVPNTPIIEPHYIYCISNKNIDMFYTLYKWAKPFSYLKLFFMSCLNNNLVVSNFLLKNNSGIVKQDSIFDELFLDVCKKGYYEMVIFLLPLTKNPDYITIFRKVASRGHLDILKLVTDCIVDKELLDFEQSFIKCCERGHVDIIKYLSKWPVDKTVGFSKSFIHGHVKILEYLYKSDNTLINTINEHHLILACNNNSAKSFIFLSNYKNDIAIPDECLCLALQSNNYCLVEYLILNGFCVDDITYCIAIKNANLDIISLIDTYFELEYIPKFLTDTLLTHNAQLFKYMLDKYTIVDGIVNIATYNSLINIIFAEKIVESCYVLLEHLDNKNIKLDLNRFLDTAIAQRSAELLSVLLEHGYPISDIQFNNIVNMGDQYLLEVAINTNVNLKLNSSALLNTIVHNNDEILKILKSTGMLPPYDIYESGLVVFDNKFVKVRDANIYSILYNAENLRINYSVIDLPNEKCIICYEPLINNSIKTSCGHMYHKDCILKWLVTNFNCPYCRQILYL
jgi:hypothetical protein